jgi:hypothetical protein
MQKYIQEQHTTQMPLNYAQKVIDAGYQLQPDYGQLFMADNDKRKEEFIYAINCDGFVYPSLMVYYFFVHCASGDDHNEFGVAGGWYGYRGTSALANCVPGPNSVQLISVAMFTTC